MTGKLGLALFVVVLGSACATTSRQPRVSIPVTTPPAAVSRPAAPDATAEIAVLSEPAPAVAATAPGDLVTTAAEPAAPHAAVDDLEHIPEFPALADPLLRETAADSARSIEPGFPIEINDRVLSFLEYYQNGRGRTTMAVGLERMGRWRPMIERILAEEDVPLELIHLAQAESVFLPLALSSANAKGMWQFIAARGEEYGLRRNLWIDERSDPEKSTRAAARHLRDLYEDFGDWHLAMAAYNAGPARVRRDLQRTGAATFWELADQRALPQETINYIPTIVAFMIIGSDPEKYGFSVNPQPPLDTERVAVDKATDLRLIAETLDVSLETLKELNPHILRWTTPPDDSEFELILPAGHAQRFQERIAPLPANERILFEYHTIRQGDTLSALARRYGASVADLTMANSISERSILRIGQVLMIPLSGVQGTAARTSASASNPAPATYTVRRGDTLSQIASRYNVTVNNIKDWNKLSSNTILVGQTLALAAPVAPASETELRAVVHEVTPGETLIRIATTYRTTVDAILSWNERSDLTVLYPGDRITIFVGSDE